MEKELQLSQKESGRLRRWENEKWIIYKEIERVIKMVGDCDIETKE